MTETCQGIAVEKRNVKVDAISVIKDREKQQCSRCRCYGNGRFNVELIKPP